MILISRLLFYRDYVGLTLWPFIILKEPHLKTDTVLVNHERIHLRQQQELLLFPFYLLYLIEWLFRSIYYWDSYKAYKNLSFEREAYSHEHDLEYLQHRRPFSFLRYL